ncbi:MAG: response regulator receiver protein [Pedosphaera sp.]|nr:response regulator receiver protein [Pedosphaera sp.]
MNATITPTILMVNDNSSDVEFLALAVKRSGLAAQVIPVRDVAAAKSYLLGEGAFADRAAFPEPYMVVLDSQLPKTSDPDLILWIRHQVAFEKLPIVVNNDDGNLALRGELYQKGANFIFKRTGELGQLAHNLLTVHKVWQQLGIICIQSLIETGLHAHQG